MSIFTSTTRAKRSGSLVFLPCFSLSILYINKVGGTNIGSPLTVHVYFHEYNTCKKIRITCFPALFLFVNTEHKKVGGTNIGSPLTVHVYFHRGGDGSAHVVVCRLQNIDYSI